MIIGGRFTSLTDSNGRVFRNRLAKVDIDTCSIDRNWNPANMDARVDELAVSGNRLFVGGAFNNAGGQGIEKLAELNFSTGALNSNFSFDFDADNPVKAIGVSPNGTRLGIVFSGTRIDNTSLRGTAIFNISNTGNPSLTGHRLATFANAFEHWDRITEGDVAADFSSFVIAGGARNEADFVSLIPTGESSNQFGWQHFMRDSSFSIAVSNNAVYAGGHFCFIDDGPGNSQRLSPNTGPSVCTGTETGNGVFRTQIAALNLRDGTPLNWNPGSDAFRGVGALRVVPRGLLLGHDGEFVDNRRVGTTAFFDFGAGAAPPPPPTPTPTPTPTPNPGNGQTCTVTNAGNGNVTLSWSAIAGENVYSVRRNNSWVTDRNNLTFTTQGSTGDNFVIRSRQAGTTTDTTCS